MILQLRGRGIPSLYGEASHRKLLHHVGAERATLVIVALPQVEAADLAVRRIRDLNRHVPVLARAHGAREAEQLLNVGATEVIQPEVEAAATLIRHALMHLRLPKERILAHLDRFRKEAPSPP